MKNTINLEALKAAPPAVVLAGEKLMGFGLSDWVFIATLAYLVMQMGFLAYKWYRLYKDKHPHIE